jgi:uncharacterized membrane protein YjjB (DUF3815 family)
VRIVAEPLEAYVEGYVITGGGNPEVIKIARTSLTLIVLPALFVTVPGDYLSAAAAELLGGRLTAGRARLVFGFYVMGLIVIGIVAAAGATGHLEAVYQTVGAPR